MAVIAPPSSLCAPGFSALTVRRRPAAAAARPAVSMRVVAVASPTRETTGLQYKKLGDSDLVISNVTLGTMTWGGQNSEAEAHEQLSYAFDHGINILDTAEGVITPLPLLMLDVFAFCKSSLMCSAMKAYLETDGIQEFTR